MNSIWLFRSNLKNLESYHKYTNLEDFEKNCHDFYLLMLIWFLRNNIFDEAIVWRLTNKGKDDIIFDINGKQFIQRWVKSFDGIFKYNKPKVSFFRGGFPEYDSITKKNPNFFGLKLYLSAGKRITPQYGGIYDKLLMESDEDLRRYKNSIPFYKTANPNIFYPIENMNKRYDLCIVSNFKQLRMKGQDFFIEQISSSKVLKKLNIVHCGNEPQKGKKICQKHGVSNIEFLGELNKSKLNRVINQSKYGIVLSNKVDGSPRVSSEILCSGTPLLIRQTTRLLPYYKKHGCVTFIDSKMSEVIDKCQTKKHYENLRNSLLSKGLDRLSIETICRMNLKFW